LNEREVEKEEDLMVEKLLPKEISPVFLQFLDCLYQIWTQYPTEFEYDERLLEFLYIASNSCEFGNFVFNSEFERKSFMKLGGDDYVEKNTKSVWQHVYENQEVFKNFLFDQKQGVLYPKSKNLRYWSKVYKISRVASDDSVAVMKIDDVEGVAKSERMEPEIIALKSEPVKRVDQLKVISDGGSSGSSWMDVNYSDTRNVSDVNIPNPLM
jgi:virulence-associated protein VapD